MLTIILLISHSNQAQYLLDYTSMKILNVNGHEYKCVNFDSQILVHRSSTWCSVTFQTYKDGTPMGYNIFGNPPFVIPPTNLEEITNQMYEEIFNKHQIVPTEQGKLRVYLYINDSGYIIGCEFWYYEGLYSEINMGTFSDFEDKLKTIRFTVTDEGKKLNYNIWSLHF